VTTKHDVIAAHRAHPEWTPSDIAEHLKCCSAYVRATAMRNNIKLPHGKRGPRPPTPTKLRERAAKLRENAARMIAMADDLDLR
jgi:hypothetical protein